MLTTFATTTLLCSMLYMRVGILLRFLKHYYITPSFYNDVQFESMTLV